MIRDTNGNCCCLANYGNGPLLIGKSQCDKNQEISATKSRKSEGAPGVGMVKHHWEQIGRHMGRFQLHRNKMSDGNNQEIPGGNGSANS